MGFLEWLLVVFTMCVVVAYLADALEPQARLWVRTGVLVVFFIFLIWALCHPLPHRPHGFAL